MAQIQREANLGRVAEPVVAIDPARYGPVSTCLGFVRGNTVERFVTWNGLDTMQTADRAAREMQKYGIRPRTAFGPSWGRVVVDVIGIGSGVKDRLQQLGFAVEEFNGGGLPTTDRDPLLNRRSGSYWHLKTMLEEDRIAVPHDEELFSELLAITWKPTASGQIQLEPKKQLKGRLGRSPDRADALSMALAPMPGRAHGFVWRV